MAQTVKRLYPYRVGIGFEGCILETHLIYARSMTEAYYAGLKYLHPDKGFNYVSATRIKAAAEKCAV